MARPKSWFRPKEFNVAKKTARVREHSLYKYTRNLRGGASETGYYVGNHLPARLKHAQLELKTL